MPVSAPERGRSERTSPCLRRRLGSSVRCWSTGGLPSVPMWDGLMRAVVVDTFGDASVLARRGERIQRRWARARRPDGEQMRQRHLGLRHGAGGQSLVRW